jgi:hypothetical protein
MDTPREVASGLLYGLAVGSLGSCSAAREGRVDGTVGALVSVGLLCLEEAELWRGHLFRADSEQLRSERVLGSMGMPSVVDAASCEEAARVLGELLDAVAVREGEEEQLARFRFQGALDALAEIGAVERDGWVARLRGCSPSARVEWEAARRDAARPYTPTGTEQELLAVFAGSSELLEGWRVLYGLRFADGISFACWPEPGRKRREDQVPVDDREVDAWDFDLRDDLGTEYGGGNAWGGEDGIYGVSFPAGRLDTAPAWVELVGPAGNAIRFSL